MKTITITKEHLDAAEAINRANPCVGFDAKNAVGQGVDPTNPNAVCFCAIGAISKVLGTDVRDVKGFCASAVYCPHDDAFEYDRLAHPEHLDTAWAEARHQLIGKMVEVPE